MNSVTPLTWFETTKNNNLEGNNNNKKKIIIKKKKNKNTNQYEDKKLNILDMIEKVQSNGFDDQRFSSNNNNKMNKNLILSLNVSKFIHLFIIIRTIIICRTPNHSLSISNWMIQSLCLINYL